MFIPLHDQNKLTSIKLQYVTLILIAINAVIWALTANPQATETISANAVFYSYGFIPAVVRDVTELPVELVVIPETASYVTYAFLHGDFMHMAGNMLFLWVFGDNVEDAMGHFRFLIFYIVCAALAAFTHGFFAPNSEVPLVGASGAAAGIIGAYLMLHPKVKVWVLALGRIPLRLSAMWVLGGWIAFQLFNFFVNGESEVSWSSHIGGFLAGVLLVVLFKKSDVPLFDANISSTTDSSNSTQELEEKTSNAVKSSHQWGRDEK